MKDLRLSPTNDGGFNQPSRLSVMPTVVSPLAEEGQQVRAIVILAQDFK